MYSRGARDRFRSRSPPRRTVTSRENKRRLFRGTVTHGGHVDTAASREELVK